MSIYCSTAILGDPEDPDSVGVVLVRDGGGRNDYPSVETYERGDADGAWIPSWCVPGHEGSMEGEDAPAPWYRLSTSHPEVLLDEDAVRALRDDLTRWLDAKKTRPESTDA